MAGRFFTKPKQLATPSGGKGKRSLTLPPTQEDITRAKRLQSILATARMLGVPPKMDKWAHEFRLLSKMIEAHRVDEVLTWLESNSKMIGKHFVTKIFTAKRFRELFIELESFITDHLKDQFTPTPEGQAITSILLRSWPHDSKQDLCRIVEISLQGISLVVDKVTKIRDRWTKHFDQFKDPKTGLRKNLGGKDWIYWWYLDKRLLPQLRGKRHSEFVSWWLGSIVKPRLTNWSGKLDYFVFAPGGDVYRDYMGAWAATCGTLESWHRLEKEMK